MSRETKRERIIAEIKERVEDNGYQAFIIWLGNKLLLTATTYLLVSCKEWKPMNGDKHTAVSRLDL